MLTIELNKKTVIVTVLIVSAVFLAGILASAFVVGWKLADVEEQVSDLEQAAKTAREPTSEKRIGSAPSSLSQTGQPEQSLRQILSASDLMLETETDPERRWQILEQRRAVELLLQAQKFGASPQPSRPGR